MRMNKLSLRVVIALLILLSKHDMNLASTLLVNVLNSIDTTINGISETMDYGWFWFLAQPMLWSINMLHKFVMNYGLAIIIFTILIRFLMWPLTRKSYTSMIAMQKMQPEMQRVQKLYANDNNEEGSNLMYIYLLGAFTKGFYLQVPEYVQNIFIYFNFSFL